MTTNEKVARRKLSLLELAKELNKVSKACKLILGAFSQADQGCSVC